MHSVWWLRRGVSARARQARAQSGVRLPCAASAYSQLTHSHDVAFLVSDGGGTTIRGDHVSSAASLGDVQYHG